MSSPNITIGKSPLPTKGLVNIRSDEKSPLPTKGLVNIRSDEFTGKDPLNIN